MREHLHSRPFPFLLPNHFDILQVIPVTFVVIPATLSVVSHLSFSYYMSDLVNYLHIHKKREMAQSLGNICVELGGEGVRSPG